MRTLIISTAAIAALILTALTNDVVAQTGGPPGVRGFGIETIQPVKNETVKGMTKTVSLSYVARFLCGRIPQSTPEDPNPQAFPLGPATYLSSITIYNPTDSAVQFTRRASSIPLNLQPGVVGTSAVVNLGPREAIETDCSTIASLLSAPPFSMSSGFFTGFAEIIISTSSTGLGSLPEPPLLRVVAGYTVCNRPGEEDEGGCGGGEHTP